MALAGVGSAINFLGKLLVEEAKYLYVVEEKVEELQDELKWMACFLHDVDAKQDRDARMREWIRQISWLAYQSEDIIETFILKVEFQRRRGGLLNKLKRYCCIIREFMALHELGSDIDALTLKISKLTSRLQAYGIQTIEQGNNSSVRREELRKSYAHQVQDDKNIIGLEKDVDVVVEKLKANDNRVIALCGIGGLGKTTLAKKVYHHNDVREYFDAFAWASISQQCQIRSVLVELFRCLISEDVDNRKTDAYLKEMLCAVQQKKRCLVILDDIWTKETWDSLKAAFPIDKPNSSCGKLMLTTRKKNIACYVDDKAYIHDQKLMDAGKSQLLLKKKLGSHLSNIFGQEQGLEANELVEEMLEYCGGLPLAITTLGGILATKKSLEEWKTTRNNIKRLLPSAIEGGLSCEEVLSLSYYDLPFHLKPCFLYLGIFPEDTEISVTKLIELWMAEGFLSTNDSNNEDYIHQQGSKLKELGEAYLTELVDRSMVQVGSTRWNGRIETCRVHDLVRELCISKAEEENFLKVLIRRDLVSSSSISRMLQRPPLAFPLNSRKRYRRLAIHDDEDGFQKVVTSIVSTPKKKINAPLHVKSLLCSRTDNFILIEAVIKQFKLLRVLDLFGIKIDVLPKGVGELVHLRYLSIRDSLINEVPSSIMKLKSLQMLDLQCKSIFGVRWSPDMIWRMRQLRHVYMPSRINKPSMVERISYKLMSFNLHQKGEGGLLNHNMEVLCNFNGLHQLKEVAELTNLRKLTIKQEIKEKEELKHIINSQSLLYGSLKHISFTLRGEVLIEYEDALRDLPCLYKMKVCIEGRISSASSLSGDCSLGPNMLPQSITTLILNNNEIMNPNAMQIIEKLNNLIKLYLNCNSYIGESMTCSNGGFPKLAFLSIRDLKNLKELTIEIGAMPLLQILIIWDCPNLKTTFLDGIKSLPNLKEFEIVFMPTHICDKVREWKESVVKRDDGDSKGATNEVEDQGLTNSNKVIIQHIPTIKLYNELCH